MTEDTNSGSVLNKNDIYSLIDATPPLITNHTDLESQVQPHGFDLTLKTLHTFKSSGQVDFTNHERIISDTKTLQFNTNGYIHLEPKSYLITFNEEIRMPLDLMALAMPRSTLLRCGVSVHTAVWDAGYQGRSEALMTVYNNEGFRVKQGARLIQLVFIKLTSPLAKGYDGIFFQENL
mgnify:FL=1